VPDNGLGRGLLILAPDTKALAPVGCALLLDKLLQGALTLLGCDGDGLSPFGVSLACVPLLRRGGWYGAMMPQRASATSWAGPVEPGAGDTSLVACAASCRTVPRSCRGAVGAPKSPASAELAASAMASTSSCS